MRLAKDRLVVAFGPVADPKDTYGIGIIQLEDGVHPKSLAANDPVIVAGTGFSFEITRCHS